MPKILQPFTKPLALLPEILAFLSLGIILVGISCQSFFLIEKKIVLIILLSITLLSISALSLLSKLQRTIFTSLVLFGAIFLCYSFFGLQHPVSLLLTLNSFFYLYFFNPLANCFVTIAVALLAARTLTNNQNLIKIIGESFNLFSYLDYGLILSAISLICWVIVQLKHYQHKKSFEEMTHDSRLLAHELSHPLTSILFELELLSQKSNLPKNSMQRITNISQLLNLSTNLLHCFSQPRKKIDQKSFDLDEIILLTVNLLQYKAKQKNIKLKPISHLQQPIKLKGKSCYFYQILANLIINSIESCQKQTLDHKTKTVEIISKLENNFACISIKDRNSKSIKPHFLTRLISQTSFSKPIEQGLGLLIVEDLVKNYFSGKISYCSSCKNGNEINIKLPTL